ncbi:MAG: c-type cytochrome [Proteobacteria bacterium]|nr:c-type cytochrome [Pseudomonadota bacterium]
MADKKKRDVVRPYVVDGIEEYDNPMPTWWLGLFNATIVFGLAYMVWFHVLDKPSLKEELAADQKAYQQLLASKQPQDPATPSNPEDLKRRLKEPKLIEEGKAVFAVNCAPCHGQLGEGTVGPNLTDRFWIHGAQPDEIVATITYGVPANGMIAWGPILGPQKIEAAAAYVLSLQGSNPPNGKAPQGDQY